MTNPFEASRTAARYHAGRPFHHERTLRRILEAVPVEAGGVAVDVAAGTGLSMRALRAHGFVAVGVEPVEAMIALAGRSPGSSPVVAVAEWLPLQAGVASLVTVSSAVHWFDRARFLAEARRLLRHDGAVVLYDHAGIHLPDDPSFSEWSSSAYGPRYPAPPRGPMAGTDGGDGHADEAAAAGLRRCYQDAWVDLVSFDHTGLVAYLMTQSNVVDAIESGRESEDGVRAWLEDSTARFFSASATREFGFFVMVEALRPAP